MRTRMSGLLGLIATAASLMLAIPAMAQITTGTVFGTVKDSQGGVMPGASVVVISESRGTKSEPVITDERGDFAIPSVTPGSYTVEVSMPSFKTLAKTGVAVSGGDRVSLGSLVLEVGGTTERITVTSDAPLLQAQSGERSFVVDSTAVENLPINHANFASLASLSPGVNATGFGAPTRTGGGGQTNVVMDGISVMDTGNNGQMLQLNTDAVAEVKVLTSNYQAEYGRSSGVQITTVTKSGTNRFHGSVYDIKRNSDWDSKTWVADKNGDPKVKSKQDDWGYTVGGPVGKPGGANKLFFFVATEYRPRNSGGAINRFRLPTALERQGDFSQTRDNQGNVFNLIRDASTGLPCTAANTSGCFQANGVLGRIPANRLYQPSLNILSMYPLPNHVQLPGENYNHEAQQPVLNTYTYQPTVRFDYQLSPALRLTGKFNGQNNAPGNPVVPGSLPGFNDTQRIKGTNWTSTWAVTGNYVINPTTFIEATYGRAKNYLSNPIVSPASDSRTTGLSSLPLLFPEANDIDSGYFGFEALSKSPPPWFENGRSWLPPNFAWGTRIGCAASFNGGVNAPCPPNLNYPGALNTNPTYDISVNLTKVAGRHTFKFGVYTNHSLKAQNINLFGGALPFKGDMNFANDPNNSFDTGFGYANAAIGTVSTYSQQSKFVEGYYVYWNREGYLQDNWKVNNRFTLDYGLRIVNQQPQHDFYGHSGNFLPDRWSPTNAPLLYLPGCPGGVYPCPATRQAMHPVTGALLGAGSAIRIGQLVPNTGNPTQGLFQQGQGISEFGYIWPSVAFAPRVGGAFDVMGDQRLVVRGGGGVFFDRPPSDAVQNLVSNPPFSQGVILQGVDLRTLAGGASGPLPATRLFAHEYDGGLPSSFQWNAGVQATLPFASAIDVSYVGQHAWNQQSGVGAGGAAGSGQNINAIDLGTAFLPQFQDPTLAPNATPGRNAVTSDLMRGYKGYADILQMQGTYYRTFHSIQSQFTRRFVNGFQAGVSWTWTLSDKGTTGINPVYQHAADGSFRLVDNWDRYVELNEDQGTIDHTIKATWVWDLPDVNGDTPARRVLAAIANDWQLSGVFTGTSGTPYTMGFGYQSGESNVNLTGSPNYPAMIRITGEPGRGCSSNQYAQFNASAFAGPVAPSLGLESGRNYMTGCGDHTVDLAIARNIRLGGSRTVQLRVDAFNAFDTVIYNARQTSLTLASSTNQTVSNSQTLPDGSVNPNRLTPRNAGFGAVTGAQAMRTVQLQLRFSF